MTQQVMCRCMKCGISMTCTSMGKRDGRSICPQCLKKEEANG